MARFLVVPASFSIFNLLLAALHLSSSAGYGAAGTMKSTGGQPTVLFTFGGSYADTGNHNASDVDPRMTTSWHPPYGHTWPGTPTGRSSDGNVSTDFIASFLGIPSPVPYREVMSDNISQAMKHGVNFAYGGAGVFSTFSSEIPNITIQIAQFQALILEGGVFSVENISSSAIALLVLGGNDYAEFDMEDHSAPEDAIWKFVPEVVDGIADAVRSLYELGFLKFMVSNVQPLGCQPGSASLSNYTTCDETHNKISQFHNALLSAHIYELEKLLPGLEILTLDFYSSFETVLNQTGLAAPCCQGISSEYECGDWFNGTAQSTVCSDLSQTFFWDNHHPTQASWTKVFEALSEQFALKFEGLPRAISPLTHLISATTPM